MVVRKNHRSIDINQRAVPLETAPIAQQHKKLSETTTMRNLYTLCIVAATLLFVSGTAMADMSDYQFFHGTGSAVDMSSASSILSNGTDDGSSSAESIGFTFDFDGTDYTYFKASANGVITLGTSSSLSDPDFYAYENLNQSAVYPIIAPYWDDQILNADMKYRVTGSAPNRVCVIEFSTYLFAHSTSDTYHYQVRLYEHTNTIEFYYYSMSSAQTTNGNRVIGAAGSTSNFLSIGTGSSPTYSTTSNIQNDFSSNPIADNTLYTITRCVVNVELAGVPSEGGTTNMADQDTLLVGKEIQRGETGSYTPFKVFQGDNPCDTRTASFAVNGPAAGDYTVIPSSVTVAASESQPITIDFEPQSVGVRYATLIVTDDNGLSRSYTLAATGLTRINWIGDVNEGGTAGLSDGDTLLKDKRVRRLQSGSFMPITVENFGGNVEAPAAEISLTIVDTSGQYSIVGPSTASIGSGESFTPTIEFDPKYVGYQPATLIVNADGEIRTYVLDAFSIAPGGQFFVDSKALGPETGMFINRITCAGKVATTVPVKVVNIGAGPFVLTSLNAYRTDTTLGQGRPPYPLVFDGLGRPIPMGDYFFTRTPIAGAPTPDQFVQYPDTIAEGQTKMYYFTFVGQEPGKRFARAFVGTNGENFRGIDPFADTVDGLLTFDLYGRALGAKLADTAGDGLPEPMVFGSLRVGDTTTMTYKFTNRGHCDLKIDLERLRIIEGDVNDFTLVTAFGQNVVPGGKLTGTVVIMPDSSNSITVKFHPQRSGSRRATLFMATNDSSIYVQGFNNRGVYRFDIFGTGKTGLDYYDVTFAPALIDGPSAPAAARFDNTSVEAKTIVSVAFTGADAAQFSEDAANPWPTLPYTINPGGSLQLHVLLTATGSPGPRHAALQVTLEDGEVLNVDLSGEAGIRTLAATPGSMFDGVKITVGDLERQTLMLTNTGTLPLTISSMSLGGAGASDYSLGLFPRKRIDPGATEYLEVTYEPINPATTSTATLSIVSDGGNVDVPLNGASQGTLRGGDVHGDGVVPSESGDHDGVSGVTTLGGAEGIQLMGVRPNPTSGASTISFRLGSPQQVRLEIYDVDGRLVRTLVDGMLGAGEHHRTIAAGALATGVYHYQLRSPDGTLSGRLVVVR